MGLQNFSCSIPFWCVSIGVEKEGILNWGAIYNPVTDEMFYAEKGYGAFLNEKPLKVGQKKDLSKTVIATGDYYYRGEDFRKSMDLILKVYEKSRVVRNPGSVALSLAYTAAGRYDSFFLENFN